jgi:hypothetical protein
MLLFLIIEIVYGVFIQIIFGLNTLDKLELFYIMIPLRFIEIITIKIWGGEHK